MLRRGKDAWGDGAVVRYHKKGGTDPLEPVTIAKQFHADFAVQPPFSGIRVGFAYPLLRSSQGTQRTS